ncbi:aminotransferase class III-fold pyridoxal phosphate-dependent enzyme [Castellaniella sp. GW247-6E4]|uniref:aspartate aminotransferase family protein n=1 Tax=Castellaniella sp. GW247-6E4 TaxID=3140380 RepID=UPI003315D624
MNHLVGGISSAGRALPDLDGQRFLAERAQGPYLWDTRGVRYLDTAMSFGATMLGHAPRAVVEAVNGMFSKMPMPSFAHETEERAAAALAACTGPLSRVIFVNSGSEAVHLACRAARASTGRTRIAKFAAGYDGWYDQLAFGNASSREAGMGAGARPEKDGMLLLRYNDFQDIERLFDECPDIAAVLIEPVLANAGCLEPAPGYLKAVADGARRHGAVVILDEVLMGFRLHAGLCGHLYGVDADLATVGKAIGSGTAVAAVVGKPEIMDVFENRRAVRAGTYSGNPPVCAAVLATLEQLQAQDYPALLARGNALRDRLARIFRDAGLPFSTTGFGCVFTPWAHDEPPTTYAAAFGAASTEWTLDLHLALRRAGVLIMPFAFGRLYLTFAHDEAVVEELAAGFVTAVQTLAGVSK